MRDLTINNLVITGREPDMIDASGFMSEQKKEKKRGGNE